MSTPVEKKFLFLWGGASPSALSLAGGNSAAPPVIKEPVAPGDPATCQIAPGRETRIEIQKGKSGLGLSIVGGADTLLVSDPTSPRALPTERNMVRRRSFESQKDVHRWCSSHIAAVRWLLLEEAFQLQAETEAPAASSANSNDIRLQFVSFRVDARSHGDCCFCAPKYDHCDQNITTRPIFLCFVFIWSACARLR